MFIFRKAADLNQYLDRQRHTGKTVGFVPTMGALHEGHISLIAASQAANALTVCSVFVNPSQFNNAEDLEKYPRTIAQDIVLLEQAGCDVLFNPEVEEMYPGGVEKRERSLGFVATVLEGTFRPGHFDGVAEVVQRLFNMVKPDHAYFGLKDYQQCMVINALVEQERIPVQLHFAETRREADGLAMSSRNRRLSGQERQWATQIPQTLSWIKAHFAEMPVEALEAQGKAMLNAHLRTEYLSIMEAGTLKPLTDKSRPAVVLVAAWCGNVRLIDNLLLNN